MLVQEMQTCLWVPLEKHVEPILIYHLYGLIEIMGYFVPFGYIRGQSSHLSQHQSKKPVFHYKYILSKLLFLVLFKNWLQ
jgi:hypothetical protein